MNKEDNKRFAAVMAALGEIFDTGRGPTAVKTELYFQALEEFTIEQIELAAKKLIKVREFPSFPKPAEISNIILESLKPKGLEAWGMVMTGLERGEQPKDAQIRLVIDRLGGWSWLQGRSYDELHWLEKRFIDHFQDVSKNNYLELPISSGIKKLSEKLKKIME
ncbi:MAG: hypothetical protein JXB23_17285 [Candidatus Aminicenantes bacterium]|nr:hypothetical protein [Candidatus Aminicenantes bacterium]